MEDPIAKFRIWWDKALANSPLRQKSAVCVSTISEDGFPTGRFVDLKSVDSNGFTFCTFMDSNKGLHIQRNEKVALTFWWDHVGYQVRVMGGASEISNTLALEYWGTRSRDAQLTTHCFQQSRTLESEAHLPLAFEKARSECQDQPVPKPARWGGYVVAPIAIEFLTFKENRLHFRELFQPEHLGWRKSLLQP